MTLNDNRDLAERFKLDGRVAVITGGAGLLGQRHAEAIAEMGGVPWLVDINEEKANEAAERISRTYAVTAKAAVCDITSVSQVTALQGAILSGYGSVDILINNAANNPPPSIADPRVSRLENFSLESWNRDIAVGLTGAFICSQVFGAGMAHRRSGVILNIASDLGLIAPDQRIYRTSADSFETQTVKPVTYSVVKAGLIGLTRYLSTYWAHLNVRANALAPGGVFAGQDQDFVRRLCSLIPLGRMASEDEYKAAVAFLVSDASSYMNGAVLTVDGGRTVW